MSASDESKLEFILKRDRVAVLAGLGGVTALAWGYLALLAVGMGDMSEAVGGAMTMAAAEPWSAADFVLMFLMWSVMMLGMMVPSAAPMILIFAMVARKSRSQGKPFTPVSAFVAGYVAVWGGFALGATMLQGILEQWALLSPMMVSNSPLLGGGLLIAAGLYQWTPLKNACLKHCQSPLQFITTSWRTGTGGAFRMGVEHGAFCLGCCWVLMGLLFLGGVMNLLWIALIAAFVLVEKVMPRGAQAGRLSGLLLVLAGAYVLA
jgi:predicted metal-binding membrane protein